MEKVEIPYDFRLALAIAIAKSRGHSAVSKKDRHWREKAKMYKQELNALKQQVQESEENDTLDKLPVLGPCDCLFLGAGEQRVQMKELESPLLSDKEISKFSVQLFLRNVRRFNRAKQKKRAGNTTVLSSLVAREVSPSPAHELKEHLASVLQFITESLCHAQTIQNVCCEVSDSGSSIIDINQEQISKTKAFSAYVHHSVKFIKGSIPRLIDQGGEEKYNVKEMVQDLTSGLTFRLLNYTSEKDGRLDSGPDARVWIQQTSYQLGSSPYLGHEFLLITSKLIAEVAGSLVYLDPFHGGVAQTYENLYFLFQLFEKLLSDHLCEWASAGQLNVDILQNTLECHFSTVKFLGRFRFWSSLVLQYSNRLTGEIIAQLDAVVSRNLCAEGAQHMALLYLIEMATSATLDP